MEIVPNPDVSAPDDLKQWVLEIVEARKCPACRCVFVYSGDCIHCSPCQREHDEFLTDLFTMNNLDAVAPDFGFVPIRY